jgi:hypothetical protein
MGKYTSRKREVYLRARSKHHLKVRRCANEEELVGPLKEIGFSTYTMENMTFETAD